MPLSNIGDPLCIVRMYYWHHSCSIHVLPLHFGDADDMHVRTRPGQAFQCFTFQIMLYPTALQLF